MSNPAGQHQHAQHQAMRNMFPQGANAHMNPAMHGGLGFPAGYNPQIQFNASQHTQQQYQNMAMGVGANVTMQQARMMQLRQAQVAQAQAQAQAQVQAQAKAQAQAQGQVQQQNMIQNPGIGANGAGPSSNPAALGARVPNSGMTPINPATGGGADQVPEKHKQQLIALLQQITHSGVTSAQVTSTIAPHLPAILLLAKTGQLNEVQMGQLKLLVRLVTDKNRGSAQTGQQQNGQQQNQVQRSQQASPQVPAMGSSFPNSPATMGTPPQPQSQPNPQLTAQQNMNLGIPQNAMLRAQTSSPHIQGPGSLQNRAQAQNQTMQAQQLSQPPQNHLPTPQQLHLQSQGHLQPIGSPATPPPPVAGIKRKAPPGTLTLPPNELVQTQPQANGIGGMQLNGGVMPHQPNGMGQPANGLGQQANGMQANGMGQQAQPGQQQRQPGSNGQEGQVPTGVPTTQAQLSAQFAALPQHILANLLQRAKVYAAQQNRHDEQSIVQVAKMLLLRHQQATQQAQARAQAQAQAQAAMGGQPSTQTPVQPPVVAQPGPLGTGQQPNVPQAPPQTHKPVQPQNPIQPQQPPQLPPSLLQPPQQHPTQPTQPPQPPVQPQPQLTQPTPQAPLMAPSTSGQGQQPAQASTGTPTNDSPTAVTPQASRSATLAPSMAQINLTQSGGASPVTTPTTLTPPNPPSSSTISPSALNVTNPGPQSWPVSKNLKTHGSFRLGARPTLSQGLATGPILGTPSQLLRFGAGDEALGLGIGEAETEEKEDGAGAGGSAAAKKSGPGANEPVGVVSGRRTIQDLVAELDPKVSVDSEMESYLLARADEFIDSVMHFACRIAKHRGSDQVEPRDIQLHLERNHNIRIPGFASDEIRGALNRPSVEVKPKNVGGTDKSKKKKLNPEAAASLRAARVAAVQGARGVGKD